MWTKGMWLGLICMSFAVFAPEPAGGGPRSKGAPDSGSRVVANPAKPKYLHPIFTDHGRIVTPKGTAAQMKPGMKAIFDVTAYPDASQVVKGLDRVALNLNLARASGVDPRQLRFAVVLHGDATKAVLNDEAYARATDRSANPNLALIRELREHGVELYVCLQAMAHRTLPASGVVPEVQIGASAVSVLISKQRDGYAYLPFL